MNFEQLSVLTTIVIAFAALAALVLTGQAGIRQDLRALQTDVLAGQAELRKEMRAGQAELRKEMQAGQAELRAGQTEIRKDLKSLEVRIAVVEQRSPRSPAETGASAADPAPTALRDGRTLPPGISLLLAEAVTAPFGFMAASGPNR